MAWEMLDPAFPERLKHCEGLALRSLVTHVCRAAVEHVGLTDDVIQAAIIALNAGQYDSRDLRDNLEALVAVLDERQWDLRDRVSAGEASQDAQTHAFCLARRICRRSTDGGRGCSV